MENLKSNYKKGIMFNKQPEFFSYGLSAIINTINWTFSIYIVFSFILYLFYHFLGKDILKWESNFAENDQIFLSNFLFSFILIAFITLGIISIHFKSFYLFVVYISGIFLLNLNFLFGFTNIFKHNSNLITSYTAYTFFNSIIILSNLAVTSYMVYFYFESIGYFKYNLQELPVGHVVDEIKLRTDMMKMNYNNFMIGCKIHKYLPSLLFKKDDYYFTQELNNNKENYYIEDCCSKNNISKDNMNSKSTIDSSEFDPLK